jgi:hypothetical protein
VIDDARYGALDGWSSDGRNRGARRNPSGLLISFIVGATLTHVRAGYVHAIDFHTFWIAARTFVAGRNPYPSAASLSVWTPLRQQTFVYPLPAVGVLAPFAYLSYSTAVVLFVPLLACSIFGALWLLGVRDWRCYGAVVAWPAVLTAVSLGTLSPLLLLGWRLPGGSRARIDAIRPRWSERV